MNNDRDPAADIVAILIVEDSLTQAQYLKLILEKQGYRVLSAPNGREALDVAREQPPTLIVTDIMMPVMDGYELCSSVKTDEALKEIPVILLTSLTDPGAVLKALDCGADHFIAKPYSEDYLLSRIRYILANRELRKQTHIELCIDVVLGGKMHCITAERVQIIDFLLSASETAYHRQQELEKANEELRASKEELGGMTRHLEELNETKNRFLAMAAHDLRNPLVSIRGFSELLLKGEFGSVGEGQRGILDIIHSSANGMLALVEDLLDISVIEGGRIPLQKEQASLNRLIGERIKVSRISAARKNMRIVTSFSDEVVASFDWRRMGQVLDNLLGNAIKFSPPGTTVTVSIDAIEGEAKVSVRDEGPGIPREEQARVFNAFSRVSVKAASGEQGSGLGLAIVKKITEAHGGKVDLESDMGKGSIFSVFIPLQGRNVA